MVRKGECFFVQCTIGLDMHSILQHIALQRRKVVLPLTA